MSSMSKRRIRFPLIQLAKSRKAPGACAQRQPTGPGVDRLNDGIIMLSTFWRNLGEQGARKTAGGAAQPSESRHHLRFGINGQRIMSEVTPTLQAAHPQPQKSHDVGRAGMIWVKDSPQSTGAETRQSRIFGDRYRHEGRIRRDELLHRSIPQSDRRYAEHLSPGSSLIARLLAEQVVA